jgi:quercetin dioxygenase-like cupin family protein
MITRRELTNSVGVGFAALVAAALPASRAEAAAPQHEHDSQDHSTPGATMDAKSLITQPITGLGDFDAEMLLLTLQPKYASTPHKHSGPVFAYVLEGAVENQVAPEAVKKFSTGDSWFEPAMHTHMVMHNLSDTQQARVLVMLLTPKGKPATIR